MAYRAEIIGVGTELLLGDIVNTDAQTVSLALSELGINVYYHTVVGDNPERLRQAVAIAKERADVIITTGGLGPTYDDLTKQTLAECFGLKLALDAAQLKKIQGYFDRLGKTMTKNNEQQAWLPEGCTVLENDWGTAPGCAFCADGVHVVMLPGPPRECVPMMRERAMPYLAQLSDGVIASHNIHIIGIGESAVEDQLRTVAERMENPTLAPYAKEGEVLLRVTGKAETRAAADAMTLPVIRQVKELFGQYVYGVDVQSLEHAVVELLKKHGLTLATAESCTGGLVSGKITNVPGASDCYVGGVCSYTNALKESLLGVSRRTLERDGAVSRACAEQMARGAAERLGADIGVSVTGIAGPGGGTAEKPVGTVYLAVYCRGINWCKCIHQSNGDRARVRHIAALNALDMVRRFVENNFDTKE